MKVLSIFIDESGDFGELQGSNPYYLVSLVFHNQEADISSNIIKYERSISVAGYHFDYLHSGPLVRREQIFENYSLDDRRKLIYKILNFFLQLDIKHTTVVVNRKENPDKISLSGKIAKELKIVLEKNRDYFASFDKVIVYYDNGQNELSSILNAVFSFWFSNVEFRKAEQKKYRLLQIADFICYFELLRLKMSEKKLSTTEEKFFYRPQELKKTFLKAIDKKKLF